MGQFLYRAKFLIPGNTGLLWPLLLLLSHYTAAHGAQEVPQTCSSWFSPSSLCFESMRRYRLSWKCADTSLNSHLYGITVSSSWAGGLWILTNLLHCLLPVLPLLPQRSRQLFLCFISEKHRTTHFYTKEWHFSEWLLHQDFLLFLLCRRKTSIDLYGFGMK